MRTHLKISPAKQVLFLGCLFILFYSNQLKAQSFFSTGSYVGNSTDNRAITGIGFQPDIVMIKGGTGTTETIIRLTGMAVDASKRMNEGAATATDRIQNFLADGFEIGANADVNSNTVTYYYFCFKNQSSSFTSGVYTGDGIDDKTITGLGFQPDFLMIVPHSSFVISLATADMTAGEVCDIGTGGCGLVNRVKTLDTDGFTLGTNTSVNNASSDYSWFAGKIYGNSMEIGSYAGNGVDDRNLALTSYQPEFVMIKSANNNAMAIRSSALAGDLTCTVTTPDPSVDLVQSFYASGIQVGTNTIVNANGVNYYFLAVKENGFLPIQWQNWGVHASMVGQVLAEWTSVTETNLISFTLERSHNGTTFENIKTVTAKGTETGHHYSIPDPYPVYGNAWYRVRALSKNGESSITENILFENQNSPNDRYQFSVSPNPVKERNVSLQFRTNQENDFEVIMYDIQGKEVFGKFFPGGSNNNFASFTLPDECPPGIYMILAGDGKTKFRSKILVQN